METKTIRLYRPDEYERQPQDFYPTPDWVTQCLLDTVPLRGTVLEPCAGQGAMAKVIADAGHHQVVATDLVRRDGSVFPVLGGVDALQAPLPVDVQAIVSNPPYSTPPAAAAGRTLARAVEARRRDAVPAAAGTVGGKRQRPGADHPTPGLRRAGAAAAPNPLVHQGRGQFAAA